MEQNNFKKQLGQYFTKNNVWLNDNLLSFIKSKNINTIVDPFAGGGDLLTPFKQSYEILGYDIDPNLGWPVNDSLKNIKKISNSLCLTNPPYMAKTTTKRFKVSANYKYFLDYPEYTDLYLIALHQCIKSFDYIAAIIPETFISSKFFKNNLHSITILENNPFKDTDFPTVLCIWDKTTIFNDIKIFNHDEFIGYYKNILENIPSNDNNIVDIKFNCVYGQIGLIGIDGGKEGQYIRFCNKEEIKVEEIKNSSRLRTRIFIDVDLNDQQIKNLIKYLNNYLQTLRQKTRDVVLSPFKGNNSLGKRRRRLDYKTAEKIIIKVLIDQNFITPIFKY